MRDENISLRFRPTGVRGRIQHSRTGVVSVFLVKSNFADRKLPAVVTEGNQAAIADIQDGEKWH